MPEHLGSPDAMTNPDVQLKTDFAQVSVGLHAVLLSGAVFTKPAGVVVSNGQVFGQPAKSLFMIYNRSDLLMVVLAVPSSESRIPSSCHVPAGQTSKVSSEPACL